MSPPLKARSSAWKVLNRCLLPMTFFLVILLPSIFFGQQWAAFQVLKENRRLTEFPPFTLFFLEDLEKWYLDHFGGRADFIYYGARWQMQLMGIPINRQVLVGREQWLFYDQHYKPGQAIFADFQGKNPFTADQLKQIRSNLLHTQQALAKCGISFYLAVPPDKQTIYADMMPFRRHANTKTRADQLFKSLREEPSLRFVDLRPALHAARKIEALPIYLKSDTHWNALGAFHGVQALLDMLRQDQVLTHAGPQREDYQVSSKTISDGDIAVSLLSLPNYFLDLQINLTLPGTTEATSQSPRIDFEKSQKRLLLYGDSFAHQMHPILQHHFSQVPIILKARVEESDIRTEKPDVVVLEVLERLLGSLQTPPDQLPNCVRPMVPIDQESLRRH